MFKRLFRTKQSLADAHALYGAVMARSRDQHFYQKFDVPDTFDGRFEILVMHLFLLHARLKDEDKSSRTVSQYVFDNFIDDMDAALREVGVGDQTVPKRIAKMTRVFYGRTGAYLDALGSTDPRSDLAKVIARNLFPEGNAKGRQLPLADYMLEQREHLAVKVASELITDKDIFSDF